MCELKSNPSDFPAAAIALKERAAVAIGGNLANKALAALRTTVELPWPI
jgi:hypothetical protein